jgi:hypothetical protein
MVSRQVPRRPESATAAPAHRQHALPRHGLGKKNELKSKITKSLQNLDGLVRQIRVPQSSVRI